MTDIILFAAGLGTRMRPLTNEIPKPLVPVGNTTLIDHALELTQDTAINGRVVNVHYKANKLRRYLSDRNVSISDETDLLCDTGGGFKKALPLLKGNPVMGLNTDAVWSGPNPIPLLMDAWKDHMTCLLVVVPKERALGHKGSGDFELAPNGALTRGPGPIYTGLQLARRDVLETVPKAVFSMNVAWNNAAAQDGLFGIVYPGTWCDVGQPDSIPLAEQLLSQGCG